MTKKDYDDIFLIKTKVKFLYEDTTNRLFFRNKKRK